MILNERYKLSKRFHSDHFGSYYIANDMEDDKKEYGIKILDKNLPFNHLKDYLSENKFKIVALSHPNLVGFYQFSAIYSFDGKKSKTNMYYYLVDRFDNKNRVAYHDLNSSEKLEVLAIVIKLLRYLHFRALAYPNLTVNSILVNRNVDGLLEVKLSDFISSYLENSSTDLNPKDPTLPFYYFNFLSVVMLLKELILSDDNLRENNSLLLAELNSFTSDKLPEKLKQDYLMNLLEQHNLIKFKFDDKHYYMKKYFDTYMVERQDYTSKIINAINVKLSSSEKMNSCILLTGEKGIGKTFLLNQINFYYDVREKIVIRINCTVDCSFLDLMKMMLKNIIRRVDIPYIVIERFGQELVKILPELKTEWRVLPSKKIDVNNEKIRLYTRFIQFLKALSADNDLIIIIDDIDNNSIEAQQLLSNMIIDLKVDNIFILLAAINDHLSGQALRVAMNCFEQEQSEEYILKFIGENEQSQKLSRRIIEISQGIPYQIKSILNYYLESGVLYLGQNREWLINWQKYKQGELLNKLESAYSLKIKSLDDGAKRLLIFLAHFNNIFELVDIYNIYGGDYNNFKLNLEKLVNKDLIYLTNSYDKQYFSFYHSDIKIFALRLIATDKSTLYHQKIADYVKGMVAQDNSLMRSHISHLELAKAYNDAMLYAIKYSNYFNEHGDLDKFHYYLNIAIYNAKACGDYMQQMKLLKQLGYYQLWHQDIREAKKTFHLLSALADEHKMIKQYIDGLTLSLELDLAAGIVLDVEEPLKDLTSLLEENDYLIGQFNLTLCWSRYHLFKNNISEASNYLYELKDLSYAIDHPSFYGRYEIIKSMEAIANSNYLVAFEALNSAIRVLEGTGFYYEQSMAYYYISVLQLNILGEIRKSEISIMTALNISQENSINYNAELIYSFLAKIKNLQGEYNEALNYSFLAYEAAKTSNISLFVVRSLVDLIEEEIVLSLFSNIIVHLQALNYILSDDSVVLPIKLKNKINLLLSIYYLKIFSFEKAKDYFTKIDTEEVVFFGQIYQFEYLVQQLNLDYYHCYNYPSFNLDLDKIRALNSKAIYAANIISLKNSLMNIIFNMMCFDERSRIKPIAQIYLNLRCECNAEDVKIKESLMKEYLSKRLFKDDFANNYNLQKLNNEDRWRALLILANCCAINGDYFIALRYYLESVDIIKLQYYKLSADSQQQYIECDYLKRNIYDCINILLSKIDRTFVAKSEFNIENLFNIKHYDSILVADAFKASLEKNWEYRFGKFFADDNQFIAEISNDKNNNIEVLLLYVAQLLLADNCHLVFLDDLNRVNFSSSVIEDKNFEPEKILADFDTEKMAIIAENGKISQYGLQEKAIVIYPIKFNTKKSDFTEIDRRKYDNKFNFSSRVLIVAHVNSRLNNFTKEALMKIEQLNSLFALIIDNYLLYKRATVDVLTGVYLRSHIENKLSEEITKSHNNNLPLAVLMMDIDFFKKVNDKYGHQHGDLVLAEVATIIKKSVRDNDSVGRYGGEEFLVLLYNADVEVALIIAERIRYNIERAKLSKNADLTISIGVSVFPDMGFNGKDLIAKADIALYQSKEMGRNRVTIYNENASYMVHHSDTLSGILTGDFMTDNNICNTVNNINNLIKKKMDYKVKYHLVLSYLLDLFKAHEIALIIEQSEKAYCLSAFKQGLMEKIRTDEDYLINNLTKEGNYILWDDINETDKLTGKPVWKSYLHSDIIKNGIRIATIKLRVPIYEREFDYKDYNLLTHISGILCAMI